MPSPRRRRRLPGKVVAGFGNGDVPVVTGFGNAEVPVVTGFGNDGTGAVSGFAAGAAGRDRAPPERGRSGMRDYRMGPGRVQCGVPRTAAGNPSPCREKVSAQPTDEGPCRRWGLIPKTFQHWPRGTTPSTDPLRGPPSPSRGEGFQLVGPMMMLRILSRTWSRFVAICSLRNLSNR